MIFDCPLSLQISVYLKKSILAMQIYLVKVIRYKLNRLIYTGSANVQQYLESLLTAEGIHQ